MDTIKITNITESIKTKGDGSTLLKFSRDGASPTYAKEILAIYTLMEWPLYPAKRALRCFAFLLPHGKIHVAEVVFILQDENEEGLAGEYLGSSQIYSVLLPNNLYFAELDNAISEKIWQIFNAEGVQVEN